MAFAFAQPTPSTVKASDFSDQQITELLKQAQQQGLGIDQVEQLALAKGLPQSEAAAFKERVQQMQAQSAAVNTTSADAGSQNTDANAARAQEAVVEAGVPVSGSEVVAKPKERASSIYGQALFRSADMAVYERSLDAKAPANYELGIGDELGISLFGNSYYNQVCVVDNRGRIELGRNLGSVYVKGVKFENAKKLIRSAFSTTTNLSGSTLEVSLAYSRSIAVNLVGEVQNPGTYKIPATNTVFNALIAAGGPNDIGSLRQIELRRAGELVGTFDLYEFLQDPSSAPFVQEGDFVVVKPLGQVVNLSGSVLRPTQYELKPGEGLKELLAYAGGPSASAYLGLVNIQRQENKTQKVFTLNYDSLARVGQAVALQNGDQVFVHGRNEYTENKVRVEGPVYFPGEYAFEPGETTQDLLKKAGGLLREAFGGRQFLVRTYEDNSVSYLPLDPNQTSVGLALQKNDRLLVFAQSRFVDNLSVSINGEIRAPGSFEYKAGMTLGDLVLLSGGLVYAAELDRVEIARSNLFSPTYQPGEEYKTEILVLTVPKNPTDSAAVWNTPLQPLDIVSVRRIPNYEAQKTVTLSGEVKYPGTYVLLNKNTRVQDIVAQAGGLTPYAFPEGAQFRRPDAPGGYFVFDLPKALKSKRSEYNYRLEDGDKLIIPQVIDFVSVYGSALQFNEYNQEQRNVINTPYVSGKRAGYYVRHYGNGYAPSAWRGKTYVVEQNGRIRKSLNLYVLHVSPKVKKGAEVYVVSKEAKAKSTKEKLEKIPTDWEAVISNITTKLTGLATLWALLQP